MEYFWKAKNLWDHGWCDAVEKILYLQEYKISEALGDSFHHNFNIAFSKNNTNKKINPRHGFLPYMAALLFQFQRL